MRLCLKMQELASMIMDCKFCHLFLQANVGVLLFTHTGCSLIFVLWPIKIILIIQVEQLIQANYLTDYYKGEVLFL